MAEFINSQMVTQFMHERAMGIETDHEILYFDECIKVKKNRKSKLFTSKEPTPFINVSKHKLASPISDLAL